MRRDAVDVICTACHVPHHPALIQQTGECEDCYATRIKAEYLASPQYRVDWLASAGVPPRYRAPYNARFFPAKGDWSEWRGEPSTVVLSGPVGVGKTYLGIELAWRLRSKRTLFVRGTDAVAAMLGTDETITRGQLSGAEVLILDDLGTNTVGGAWNLVATLYAKRYDAMLPTIITTNIPVKSGKVAVPDEAMADRLRDAMVVPLAGKSRRG